jgi:hypothetical protein
VVGSGTAGAQRRPHWLGRVGGQGEDGDQPVAAATGRSRIGDGGAVGQQVRGVGVLKLARVGLGEVGQGGWDRG